jgi:hypothetical protein
MSKPSTTVDPVTDAVISTEARRLLTLPANPGDSTEIARAIKRHAKTNYHVRAIVQHLLDNSEFFPTPSAVVNAAEIALTEAPPKFRPADPNCDKCGGTGRVAARIKATGGPFPGVPYDGVAHCECRLVEPRKAVTA